MFRKAAPHVPRNRSSAISSAIAMSCNNMSRPQRSAGSRGYGVDTLESRVLFAASYTITAISNVAGDYVYPDAINDSGEVVGYVTDGQDGSTAFVFKNGVLTNLNSLIQANSGLTLGVASAVNNSGEIAGSATEANSGLTERQTAFSYSNGVVTDLAPASLYTLPANATGINASGLIVGTLGSDSAAIFSNGTITGVGSDGDELLSAAGINDNGDIVGRQEGFEADSGYVRSGGVTTTLPGGAATAINNAGQIVGSSEVNSFPHAYLYSNGTSTSIFTGTAAAINESGVVVGCDGTSASQYTDAYIYSGGVATDLNTLIPANSGWVLEGATGINASGQITGSGELNGVPAGFILTPGTGTPSTGLTSLTILGASPSSITVGSSITFDAVVAGSTETPTGTVTFLDNGTPFGTPQTVGEGGTADITTTALPIGSQSITASYSGDTTYNSSTSLPNVVNVTAAQVATQAATTSTLTSSANVFEVGQTCQLTCAVAPVSGSSVAPTGTITLFEDGVQKNTETLGADGTVAVTWTANGTESSTALSFVYNGDTNYTTSTSNSITQTYLALSQLGANIKGAVIPASTVAGQPFKAKVPTTFTNDGAVLSGTYTAVLYADTSTGGLSGNQVVLQTVSKHEGLKANKAFAVNLTTKTLPATLPAGTYYLLVKVTDPDGNSNLVNTSQTIAVAAPYVALSATASAVKPATVTVKKSGAITVTLLNTGNVTASSELVLTLTPSIDGLSAVPGVTLVTTTIKRATLKPGKPSNFKLHFKVPSTLAAGTYFALINATFDGVSASAASAEFSIG